MIISVCVPTGDSFVNAMYPGMGALYTPFLCVTMTTSKRVHTGDPFVNLFLALGAWPTVSMRYHDNFSVFTHR